MAEISLTNSMVPSTNTGTLTSGMSAADARAVLDQLGINVNDVLSSGNIQSTVTAPVPKPDDLLGIRANLYSTLGVNDAQAALTQASKAAADAVTGLNKDLTSLSGRPVSLSKITGQQAQLSRVRQGDIQALQDAEKNALNVFNAKKSEADAQFAIRESEIADKRALQRQYPGAKIDFNDDNTKIAKKLAQYQKDQKKELYKDSLKEKALNLGLNTNGSRKTLESRIKKANKKALEEAQKETKLRLKQLELNIEDTKSQIANRGKDSTKPQDAIGDVLTIENPNDPLNPILVDKRTGNQIDKNKFIPQKSDGDVGGGNSTGGFWSNIGEAFSSLW